MQHRTILTVDLKPVIGDRFQPTGFPDIGAARFTRFVNGEEQQALLIESEQSIANHLERTGWDPARDAPVAELDGLPHVRVVAKDGDFLTSSRVEAHRLSSAFIREGSVDGTPGVDWLKARLGVSEDRPLAAREIAKAVFRLDPLSLIHGVFFADPKLPGQPKVARAITGVIEAHDVQPADYGGVKRELVQHKNTDSTGSSEGYGSIPFHRTMWTARRIVMSIVIDDAQMRAYGLSADATALLQTLARWEIRSLLDGGMRLRTMCDLVPVDPAGIDLPSLADLTTELRRLIPLCAEELDHGQVHHVVWARKKA